MGKTQGCDKASSCNEFTSEHSEVMIGDLLV